ncbi:MAG: NAD(P)-binding domain-containing protein [Saprospiraceae bacterium]|nr:NAD(P)-binding domain-containing protein [Bacteroidia bacterium]NNE16487.1 NAD(P)-binding domain-containing protein [Saprospiraceae bacterium]NNL93461.1 NAD(P)-binding domain-containing protein [Saprospiraceae bacterium]
MVLDKNKEPKICIIGAGCSGLTAIKNLISAGIKNVTCFEQNDYIGGNWKYTAETSHSSVCSTTHIISSKKMSEYTDFPMPEHYPDYPSHTQVLAYFESYAETFHLKQHIQFNTKVIRVSKNQDERWAIQTNDNVTHLFDYLVIANGHHSEPRHPDFAASFQGEYLHSHNFKNNTPFKDKKVLVIGAGNSGCDCAVETSRVAKKVDISLRTPQYIIPKFFLGKPSDTFNEKTLFLPMFVRNFLLKTSLKFQIGKYSDYNLPNPKHGILNAHPTLNSELLYKIRHGKVHPKPAVSKIEGRRIYFADGQQEEYDSIIAATGYKIWTPFFDSDFLDYSNADRVPLYLRMFHPDHKHLFFIGLFQPQGAIWPASDLQSQLLAHHLSGKWQLPENIAEKAEKECDEIEATFMKRKRHTIEVDYHKFANRLKKQIQSTA